MSPLKILILLRMGCYANPFGGYTPAEITSPAMHQAFEDFRHEGLIYDHVTIRTVVAAGQGLQSHPTSFLTPKGLDFVDALKSISPAPVVVNDERPPPPRYMGMIQHWKYGGYYVWQTHGGLYGINRDKDSPPHCGYSSLEALFQAKGL